MPSWTDDPATSAIHIRAIHINELRQAANTLRADAGLSPYSWSDDATVGTSTHIRATHFTELREAIQDVWTYLGVGPIPNWSVGSAPSTGRQISARDINDLRSWIDAIDVPATGNVTYYCLCFGGSCDNHSGGACGDCNDNYYEIAWPNNTSDQSCGEVQHGCGFQIVTQDICTANQVTGSIHDQCPCQPQEGCSQTPACGGQPYTDPNYVEPLMDLTTGYFLALHGNLDDGRIPVFIYALA